jgi:ferredoxin
VSDVPMRLEVDAEACVGAGQCVLAAGDVFDQRDEDGVVVVLEPRPAEGQWDAVRTAARLCPARAIRFST